MMAGSASFLTSLSYGRTHEQRAKQGSPSPRPHAAQRSGGRRRDCGRGQEERGVLVISTGNGKGKGKSSFAFSVVARAIGHGTKVAVIQFVKGHSDTGEESCYRRIAEWIPGSVSGHVSGEGFTWETQDSSRDAATAARCLGARPQLPRRFRNRTGRPRRMHLRIEVRPGERVDRLRRMTASYIHLYSHSPSNTEAAARLFLA